MQFQQQIWSSDNLRKINTAISSIFWKMNKSFIHLQKCCWGKRIELKVATFHSINNKMFLKKKKKKLSKQIVFSCNGFKEKLQKNKQNKMEILEPSSCSHLLIYLWSNTNTKKNEPRKMQMSQKESRCLNSEDVC